MGYFFDQNSEGKTVRFQISGDVPTPTELQRINAYLGRQTPPPVVPQEEMLSPYTSALRSSGSAVLTGLAKAAYEFGAPETGGGIMDYAQAMDAYTQAKSRPMANFTDIGSVSDFLGWAGDVAQSSAGYMTGPLAALATGTGLAMTAPISAPAAIAVGTVGFTGASGSQFFGENLKRQMEEQDITLEETDAKKALAAAAAQTAADVLSGKVMGLFGRIGRAVETKALAPIEQEIADRTWKEFSSKVSARTAKGAIAEAGTETFQQALEVLQANPDKLFALEPEMVNELVNAAAGGLILGGGISAIMGGEGETEISKLDRIAKNLTPELSKFGADINAALLRNMALQQADPKIMQQKAADAADAEAYATSLRQLLRDTTKPKTNPAKELSEKAELDFNNPPPPSGPEDYGVDPDALEIDMPEINPTQAAAARMVPPKSSIADLSQADESASTYPDATVDDSTKPFTQMKEQETDGSSDQTNQPKYVPDTSNMMGLAAALAEVQAAKLRREIATSEAALKEAGGDWAEVKAKADAKEKGAKAAVARLLASMGVTRANVEFVDAMVEYGTMHNPDGTVRLDAMGRPVTGIVSAAEGRYDPVDPNNPMQAAIKLSRQVWDPSMSVDEYVNAMTGVAAHELLHHLKNSNFFGNREWKALVRQASRERAKARGQDSKVNYLDRAAVMYRDPTIDTAKKQQAQRDLIEEEAVAEMFRNWVLNDYKAPPQPKSLMRRVLGAIKSLFTLHHLLNKSLTERVFRKIMSGKKGDKGYNPPSPSGLQKGQMAADAAPGPDQHIDPASAFLAKPKLSTIPIGKRIGLGVNLERQRLAYGPRMYNASLPQVVFKELIQNSWDGIKSAYIRGDLQPRHGHIFVRSIPEQQRVIVADNGSGMTPEIVENAYLQIMGSDKSDLPPEMSSGGFGLAKVAFLLAAKRLRLYTVRDEVATYFEASGDDIRDGNVQVFSTPAPGQKSGTWVDVQLPEKGEDGDGEVVDFEFPRRMDNTDLHSRPLVGDVDFIESNDFPRAGRKDGKPVYTPPPIPAPGDFTDAGWYIQQLHNVGPRATTRYKKQVEGTVSKYNLESSEEHEEYVKRLKSENKNGPDGVPFFEKIWSPGGQYQTASFLTTAVTRWGTVDVYLHDLKSQYGARGVILSSGVYQFEERLSKNPFSQDAFEYYFVLDVKPKVRALEALYPFEQNREGFSRRVQKDVAAIYSSLQKIGMSRENFNVSFKYGNPSYIDDDLQVRPSAVKQAIEDIIASKAGGKDAGISLGEKVDLDDGTMKRGDGSIVLKAGEVDFGFDPKTLEKLVVDEAVYMPLVDKTAIISNLNRDIVTIAAERLHAMRRYETVKDAQTAVNKFLRGYGEFAREIRALFSEEFGTYKPVDIQSQWEYENNGGKGRARKIDKTVIALVFDKGLHGVNFRIPFPGIGVNPFSKLDSKVYESQRYQYNNLDYYSNPEVGLGQKVMNAITGRNIESAIIETRNEEDAKWLEFMNKNVLGHVMSTIDTIIHELAHEAHMHHGESFTIEYHHLSDRLWTMKPNEMLSLQMWLNNHLIDNANIYRALLDEYHDSREKATDGDEFGGNAYQKDPAGAQQVGDIEGEVGRGGRPREAQPGDLAEREGSALQVTGYDAERSHGRADFVEEQRGLGLKPKYSVMPVDFTPPSLAMIRKSEVTETTPRGWMFVFRDYIGKNPGRATEIQDTGIMDWLAGRERAGVQFVSRKEVEARVADTLPTFEVRYSKIPFNTFRSALDDELAAAKVGAQPPRQWLNLIQSWVRKGLVKSEELQDRGLIAWLEQKSAETGLVPIKKEVVTQFLSQPIRGDMALGTIDFARGEDVGVSAEAMRNLAIKAYINKNYDKKRRAEIKKRLTELTLREKQEAERQRALNRAVLMSMPNNERPDYIAAAVAKVEVTADDIKKINKQSKNAARAELQRKIQDNPDAYPIDYNPPTDAYINYTIPGDNDSYRVLLLKGTSRMPTNAAHFNEGPGAAVQAWIRFKVRNVDVKGDNDTSRRVKALFIEEIQSDVHQKARDVGYRETTPQQAGQIADLREIMGAGRLYGGFLFNGFFGTATEPAAALKTWASKVSDAEIEGFDDVQLLSDLMTKDVVTNREGAIVHDRDELIFRPEVRSVLSDYLLPTINELRSEAGLYNQAVFGAVTGQHELQVQLNKIMSITRRIRDIKAKVRAALFDPSGALNDTGAKLHEIAKKGELDKQLEKDPRYTELSEALDESAGYGNENGEEAFYDSSYGDYPDQVTIEERLEARFKELAATAERRLAGVRGYGDSYAGMVSQIIEPVMWAVSRVESNAQRLYRFGIQMNDVRSSNRPPENLLKVGLFVDNATTLSELAQRAGDAVRKIATELEFGGVVVNETSEMPNIPYKKSWPRHMLLAALKHGIQEGAEAVVFSPGAVLNESYNATELRGNTIFVRAGSKPGTYDIYTLSDDYVTPSFLRDNKDAIEAGTFDFNDIMVKDHKSQMYDSGGADYRITPDFKGLTEADLLHPSIAQYRAQPQILGAIEQFKAYEKSLKEGGPARPQGSAIFTSERRQLLGDGPAMLGGKRAVMLRTYPALLTYSNKKRAQGLIKSYDVDYPRLMKEWTGADPKYVDLEVPGDPERMMTGTGPIIKPAFPYADLTPTAKENILGTKNTRWSKYAISPVTVQQVQNQIVYAAATNIVKKALGRLGFGANVIQKQQDRVDLLAQYLGDKMLPVGQIMDGLRAKGISLPQEFDTYLKFELMKGKTGSRLEAAEQDFFNPLLDAMRTNLKFNQLDIQSLMAAAPSFGEYASESDSVAKGMLEAYAAAMHVPERNAVGNVRDPQNPFAAGFETTEALAAQQWFQRHPSYREMVAAHRKLLDIIEFVTNASRVDGDLTPDFNKIKPGPEFAKAGYPNGFLNYVPMRGRVDEDPELDPNNPYDLKESETIKIGRGANVRGPEDWHMLGRGSHIDPVTGRTILHRPPPMIVEHTILQAMQSIIRAEKNKSTQSLYNLLVNYSDEKLEYRGRTVFLRQIAEIVHSAPVEKRLVNGVVKMLPNNLYKNAPDIVTLKMKDTDENGNPTGLIKEVSIRVKDQRLALALTGANGFGSGLIEQVLNSLGAFTQFVAKMSTQWNPLFLLTNFPRDLAASMVNLQEYEIDGLSKQVMLYVPTAGKAIYKSQDARTLGYLLTGQTAQKQRHVVDGVDWTDLLERFKRNGGDLSFYGLDDLYQMHARINDKILPRKGVLQTGRAAFSRLGNYIEAYNKTVESSIRLATFKAMLDAGMNDEMAARAAKSVTTNFDKGGIYKSQINALYLFYNASVQGNMTILSAMARSSRVRRTAGAIFVAGIIQDLANAMFADDDEKTGEKAYDLISQHTLETKAIFMDPLGISSKGFLSIPLPLGYNAIFNAGRALSRMMRGREDPGKTFNSMFGTMVDAANPMGGSSSLMAFAAPTILDPVVELSLNRDYANRNIYKPENPYDVNPPLSQRYWNHTSGTAKFIANILHDLGGGTPMTEGSILGVSTEVSPDALDHLFRFAIGGVGSAVLQTENFMTSTVPKILTGEEWETKDIPAVSKYFGNVGSSRIRDKFFEITDQSDRADKELKNAIKSGDPEAIRLAMVNNKEMLQFRQSVNALSNARLNIIRRIRLIEVNTRIPPDRRRELVLPLKDRVKEIEAKLVGLYNRRIRDAEVQ